MIIEVPNVEGALSLNPTLERGTVVSVTPVGKGVTAWFDWETGWHKMITDHDRKRKYVDGKRVPWDWSPKL